MKTFTISPDTHYGWLTGRSRNGLQVLAADDVVLYFDSDGTFITAERQERTDSWQERAKDMIDSFQPIHVQEFELVDPPISVRSLPLRYASYLLDPQSFSSEEGAELDGDIRYWKKDQLFEFTLGDDFWMTSDGIVHSH